MSTKSAKKGTKKAGTKAKAAKAEGKGRAPAVIWSREKADAARRNGVYIKLGDKRGTLALSGGKAMFAKNSQWIYVPALRVTGTRQDVERVLGELVAAGAMQSGDVKDALAGAYRAGDENSAAFLREVDELKASRAKGKSGGASKSKVATLPNSIAFYAQAIDNATVEGGKTAAPKKGRKSKAKSPAKKGGAKKSKSRSKSASPKAKAKKAGAKKSKSRSKSASPKKRGSPKGKRGAKPLADKVANLAEGKVMDVSKYLVDGSGAKVVAQPGDKSKKVLVPGTRLVSDSLNGIKKAAKALGDESLVQRWQDAKAGHDAGAEVEASRSRSPSPARTHEMSPRPLSPSLPPLPSVRSASPRSSGSGVSLPRIPTTLGSPRS